ncbi:MAG: S-adenosylmethionine:tRNA ribosyltransferase-isomerase, partial [Patescibacteria group bacterium]
MIDPYSYDYTLPQDLVAQEPASPRDSSKIFVYNTQKNEVNIGRFYNLDRYLPSNSFLVLNKTKVLPSRIYLQKENGGKVKTLFLVNEMKNDEVKAMVDRKLDIGQRVYFDNKYFFKVIGQDEHIFSFRLEFPKEQFIRLL